jgi:hypothetical protein
MISLILEIKIDKKNLNPQMIGNIYYDHIEISNDNRILISDEYYLNPSL